MKYTVSKTGYILSTDDINTLLTEAHLSKGYLKETLNDGDFFFYDKVAAEEMKRFDVDDCEVIKKQVKITVEVLDVKPKQKQGNSRRKPNSKTT